MGTSTVRPARRRATAPEYRVFRTRVARTRPLSPHFVRVTFCGDDLRSFGYAGNDQRVKVLLAQPHRTLADLSTGHDWYRRWRALPADIRPTMRTYTVRAYRESDGELDVDFVLHGRNGEPAGPLSAWAAAARPGDEAALLGPDRPGTGRMWGAEWAPPTGASTVVLAGDETAVPAIAAIVEDLPATLTGVVLGEVPTAADALGLAAPAGIEVRWLVRGAPAVQPARGALLEEAVRDVLGGVRGSPAAARGWAEADDDALLWDVPDGRPEQLGEPYVWMAGEAGAMRRLRRLARREYALPKAAVACMGYWREGRSEGTWYAE